ncbi:MAG: bifunctional DNA-formamidopyrimidine glycosylase/DNA-(apurinic or apyrimidinic site) lyase [Gammaproteobacteria bacterium]|nr:bifunctional DNA-formamidopyrimidine glycosylase/DNA-(apurinic or apyrimidinic site) lyase [Gammaproteobacteria bacterium]MCP5423675.1 bifunctional DNA-formamidopyrimidine glycosylase/DNA-(apurinic or apyrimidinic site) lyase [Gammaproteobacteria bacterium]
MPELPEVETTRRGIAPALQQQIISQVVVRESRLRWPIPADLPQRLAGQQIQAVNRRGKYLLLETGDGTALFHLGMSGSLRILRQDVPVGKHDHVDLQLANGYNLRFNDPRRFGALLWTTEPPERHPLLRDLGPEPLGPAFGGEYLYRRARGRQLAVKSFIMDGHVVVGVGNIYANEALFLAGIHPERAAGRIAESRYVVLAAAIRQVLEDAIRQGGTTLRDYVGGFGEPGYFQQSLRVYGRHNLPCQQCQTPIRLSRTGQRATYFCSRCQH